MTMRVTKEFQAQLVAAGKSSEGLGGDCVRLDLQGMEPRWSTWILPLSMEGAQMLGPHLYETVTVTVTVEASGKYEPMARDTHPATEPKP